MRIVCCLFTLLACLTASGFAFDLQCTTPHEESNYFHIGKVCICSVQNLIVSQKGEVMTSASSVVDFGRVNALRIQSQTVQFMPKFVGSLALRLQALLIRNSNLKSIERDDLSQFPNLKSLYLGSNDFDTLSSDLFACTPKLEYIGFSNMRLKHIGVSILLPLNHLKSAYFPNAGCIDFDANTPTAIKVLKTELLTKCKTQEGQKLDNRMDHLEQKNEELERRAVDSHKEIAQLKVKINDLEAKLQRNSSQLTGDVTHLNQKFQSCDKNLNACTQNWAPQLSQADSKPKHQSVDVSCKNFAIEKDSCEVIELVIATSQVSIGNVKDLHDVEFQPTSLIIRDQAVLFLPTNLCVAFPNLLELEVSSSGLFVLDQESFKGLDNLTNLNLSGNKITKIASGLFVDLKNLTALDLSANLVETIETAAFDGLEELKILKLNDNKLKEITAKIFSTIKSFDTLDLGGNVCIDLKYPETSLEQIESEILENCSAPIDFNCINSTERDVCRPEGLRVERPRAKVLEVNGICGNVTELIIEDQILNFLPHQLAQRFPMLMKLAILRSQLTLLAQNDFVGFDDLKKIEITDNNLTSIDANTFNGVQHLEHLNLSSNQIQSLPSNIFEPLTQLQELLLSNNEIKILNANIFNSTNTIKVFKIDNNLLEVIDIKVLKKLKDSIEIDFSENVCINSTYRKSEESDLSGFKLLLGEIAYECSSDE